MPARTMTEPVDRPRARAPLWLVLAALCAACGRPAPGPGTTRLVDVFDRKMVSGGAATATAPLPRTEWRFDGPTAALQGWKAGPGVAGLQLRDGRLVGRATTDFPILHLERVKGLDNADQLHSIEVRLRVSAGTRLELVLRSTPTVELETEPARGRAVTWPFESALAAGEETKTVTITAPAPITGSRIRHVLLRPTDVAGATFAIESVRLVFRREVLAGTPSGVGWQGLRDVFRETIVTRTPETARFALTRAAAAAARPLGRHAGGRGRHLPGRGRARREGERGPDAHRHHRVPLGEACGRPRRLRRRGRHARPLGDRGPSGHGRLLGRAGGAHAGRRGEGRRSWWSSCRATRCGRIISTPTATSARPRRR